MKIKIINDGCVGNTHVVNAETGEEIKGVRFVSWSIGVDTGAAAALLEFVAVPVEVTGELVTGELPDASEPEAEPDTNAGYVKPPKAFLKRQGLQRLDNDI